MKISDEQLDERLKAALSLFRDSVHELKPGVAERPVQSFTSWRLAFAVFTLLALLGAVVPVYRQRQAAMANAAAEAAKQDDALLRAVESDLSLSVPSPMQRLELLMVSGTVTDSERSK
jgi:hypothetical protein